MKRKSIGVLGLCLLGVAAAALATGCEGNKSWNISADASSSVTAELVTTEQGYTLKISGKGKMATWDSIESVPWHKQADKIEEIQISRGVTSVGDYAFAGATKVSNVILPPEITYAGTKFAARQTSIFAYTDTVEYAGGTPENLYLYRDEAFETDDRYWQSDKSKGDIVTKNETFSRDEGKYWRYTDDGKAIVNEKINVLFIGNSFTYRNGVVEFSSGVPGIFDCIAEDLGYSVETYSITGPGWYLENHAKASDTCGKQVDLVLNARNDFDYIVLQDQSTVAFENYNRFLGGIKALQTKIDATQDHAKIYLYETWGSPFSANERNITVPEMERKLREAYTRAGEECGVSVSYIGRAFTDIYTKEPSINLYASDNRHQGYTGAYMSACVHVGNMLGGDVRNTKFVGEEKYSAPTLDEQTLTALKEAAYNAVFGEESEPSVPEKPAPKPDESQKSILKIACWGRFMKEAKFNELVDDFKRYCAEQKISYEEIVGTYYQGATTDAPYYYIASFTAKVFADGDPDVVLPCADNFNANQSTLAAVELAAIDVYGQTNRRVAALNGDDLTKRFLEYVKTDRAKAILSKAD